MVMDRTRTEVSPFVETVVVVVPLWYELAKTLPTSNSY